MFGDAFREAIGGGRSSLSSVTKRCVSGEMIDVPLDYKDEVWGGSHHDAITVRVPDVLAPEEIVVIAAVASRGRLHTRSGGLTKEEADGGVPA